uniref:Uncharacterized protein n=1 Tax=Compsopogon caeruleus TaxID=31354 RepID=A0A7S1T8Y8_9RHOD
MFLKVNARDDYVTPERSNRKFPVCTEPSRSAIHFGDRRGPIPVAQYGFSLPWGQNYPPLLGETRYPPRVMTSISTVETFGLREAYSDALTRSSRHPAGRH